MRWFTAFVLIPCALVAFFLVTFVAINDELRVGFKLVSTDTESLYLSAAVGYTVTFLLALPASLLLFLRQTAHGRAQQADQPGPAFLRVAAYGLGYCAVVALLVPTGWAFLAFMFPLCVLVATSRGWAAERRAARLIPNVDARLS